MKVLYLDCSMGAAGDMLCAALYELLENTEKEKFLQQMNALLPQVKVQAEKREKCGIVGTHMQVLIHGEEEASHDHLHRENHHHHGDPHGQHHHPEDSHGHHQGEEEHHHGHDHLGEGQPHHHHHTGMKEIAGKVASFPLPERVRENAIQVYEKIAQAEGHVHGMAVDQIHFHEVGDLDAVADVTAVCLLMDMLGVEKVVSTPVCVGTGQVRCAHGILPVPAPATAHLLQGIPMYGGNIAGELCTPTGAALLKHFVSEFGELPPMQAEKIGYGMGTKDFAAANCLRAMLGTAGGSQEEEVIELSANLDDMTPESIAFAIDRLFEAGAREVYTIPVGMKKSRPGCMLCVLCLPKDREGILQAFFKHTSTIGIRETAHRRYVLDREIITRETALGKLQVKVSKGYGVVQEKYEYEDLAALALKNGLSLKEAAKKIRG